MNAKRDRCAICGGEIRQGRYSSVTAGGVITNTYRAWGHVDGGEVITAGDVIGIGDRGSPTPESHWAHPMGQPADGIVRSARVRIRMRAPDPEPSCEAGTCLHQECARIRVAERRAARLSVNG